jgi:hypothetical protein
VGKRIGSDKIEDRDILTMRITELQLIDDNFQEERRESSYHRGTQHEKEGDNC